jgi:hypothetical protein
MQGHTFLFLMRDLGVQLQYNLAATSSYDTLVRRYFLYFVNLLEILHGSWQQVSDSSKFCLFELAVNSGREKGQQCSTSA